MEWIQECGYFETQLETQETCLVIMENVGSRNKSKETKISTSQYQFNYC